MKPSVCRITSDPIDAAELLAGCASAHDGAVLLFLGIVRDHNEGRDVGHLEYHAFAAMAERVMEEIVSEAAERWEVGRVGVVHRIGRLEVGEASVAIAVASAHREAAYGASRYVIEELKKRVPIWKREGYLEGESDWLGGHEPAPRGASHG